MSVVDAPRTNQQPVKTASDNGHSMAVKPGCRPISPSCSVQYVTLEWVMPTLRSHMPAAAHVMALYHDGCEFFETIWLCQRQPCDHIEDRAAATLWRVQFTTAPCRTVRAPM